MRNVHVVLALFVLGAGCSKTAAPPAAPPPAPAAPTVTLEDIPGHQGIAVDKTPKESPRMLPPEAYIQSYLTIFGGLLNPPLALPSPDQVQIAARGADASALFDTWNDYIASLGLPDYRVDVPRAMQTNTLMLATFERAGVALCDRAVEHDIQKAPPVAQRAVFAFATPADPVDEKAFAAGFDVLHRTFLGYPSSLAPAGRLPRFFKLYSDTVSAHAAVKGSRLKPAEAGWATVCYGLVRHPEFHLY